MAIRSPVLYHNYWGVFANTGVLPNTPGYITPTNQLNKLQEGDFAYVPGPAVNAGTFYICTNPGTFSFFPDQGNGDAVWIPMLSGTTSDKFAPKYLVGNTQAPYSDSSVAYSSNGFTYIPDNGDGAGIAQALSQAAIVLGDVWIRPGIYDFGSGGVATPLTVPPGCRVQGAGVIATTLRARPFGDQGIFVLPPNPGGNPGVQSIRDMELQVPSASGSGSGSESVILVQGGGAVLNGLLIGYNTDAQSTLRNGILVNTAGNITIPQTSIESVSISPTGSTIQPGNISATSGIKVVEGQVAARNTLVLGGDIGYELRNLQIDPNSGGCILFGSEIYALDIGQYGLFSTQVVGATNATALRISNGVFGGSNTAPPPLGAGTRTAARVESGLLCSLRSCASLFWDIGVDVQPQSVDPANQANIQIDDSTFALMDLCVSFGPGTINSSVSDTDFGSAIPQAPLLPITVRRGVLVAAGVPGDVSGISIASNTIHVSDYDSSGSDTYAVRIQGATDVFIEGNEIIHDEASGAASPNAAIFIRGSNERDVVVADNKIRSTSNLAAVLAQAGAERMVFSGNVIECPERWTLYGLQLGTIGGGGPASVTVTGNVIDFQAARSGAALLIAGDRCTATGNRILPSTQGTGPAIYVDSDENAIGSNSCSLPVPPTLAAIYLSATSDNNVVIGNVCRTAPPVDNTAGGAGNEVAHNI